MKLSKELCINHRSKNESILSLQSIEAGLLILLLQKDINSSTSSVVSVIQDEESFESSNRCIYESVVLDVPLNLRDVLMSDKPLFMFLTASFSDREGVIDLNFSGSLFSHKSTNNE
jgi:hypothetical protein